MKTTEIYKAIESKSLPIIRMFGEDLTKHDKQSFEKHEGKKFIHITRETGTALILFFNIEAYPAEGQTVKGFFDRPTKADEILNGNKVYFDHYMNQLPVLFQYYDGKKVSTIKKDKAQHLFNMHQDHLRREISIQTSKATI